MSRVFVLHILKLIKFTVQFLLLVFVSSLDVEFELHPSFIRTDQTNIIHEEHEL